MKSNLDKIIKSLSDGELVCFPTETVFALSADATNNDAIERIYKLKQRDKNKPLAVMVNNIEQAMEIAEFDEIAIKISKKFLPGPLTLVLPKKQTNKLSPRINPNHKSIAIRIPDHASAQKILRKFGKPLVATSVNKSGEPSATEITQVEKYIEDTNAKIKILAEKSTVQASKQASTVIELLNNNITIHRLGSITKSQIIKSVDET